jgi:hypothetical protein
MHFTALLFFNEQVYPAETAIVEVWEELGLAQRRNPDLPGQGPSGLRPSVMV